MRLRVTLSLGFAYLLSGCSGEGLNPTTTTAASPSGSTTVTASYTWVRGATVNGDPGSFGTLGVSRPSNSPIARYDAGTTTDASGKFWMFGGYTAIGPLNDLWVFDPVNELWTWIFGNQTSNLTGTMGTLGVEARGNIPPSRSHSFVAMDASGVLWIFGGESSNFINDLWTYNSRNGLWTWLTGVSSSSAFGTYGVQGTAAANTTPGARGLGAAWTDTAGNFWVFGGSGSASANVGLLNDVWLYTVSTGRWTWMKGSNARNATGVYGTQGVANAANTPGARQSFAHWRDSNGNLWIFGGYGRDSTGALGLLSDVWTYSVSTNQWTWVAGSTVIGAVTSYGIKGVESVSSVPGGRTGMSHWIDADGKLWMHGGYDDIGGGYNLYDQFWTFNPTTSAWTWVAGTQNLNTQGVYLTMGTKNSANVIGARTSGAGFADANQQFWLFGGSGVDSANAQGNLNDVWKIQL